MESPELYAKSLGRAPYRPTRALREVRGDTGGVCAGGREGEGRRGYLPTKVLRDVRYSPAVRGYQEGAVPDVLDKVLSYGLARRCPVLRCARLRCT
eukprot:1545340-Rhodomonas_salina.2